MRAKFGIQNIDHAGARQIRGAVDDALEVTPELRQQIGPAQFAVRHRIKLAFQLCGEIIFHIAREEIRQEGCDKAPAIFGHEFAAILDHIAAIQQRLDGRGIGGRSANPQLFHRLDDAGICKTRWRLSEMLLWCHLAGGQRLVLAPRRVERAAHRLPRQGDKAPWKVLSNYLYDLPRLRYGRLNDDALEFVKAEGGKRRRLGVSRG